MKLKASCPRMAGAANNMISTEHAMSLITSTDRSCREVLACSPERRAFGALVKLSAMEGNDWSHLTASAM